MTSKEAVLEDLKQGVINFDEEKVKVAAQQVLDEGYVPGGHHGWPGRRHGGRWRPL